jgi:hypothetical protein
MSRLARALMLAATLAATTLAGLTAAAPAPAPPSRQPAWLVPAIGALATALALLGIRATMITRRRRGRVRVRQPA